MAVDSITTKSVCYCNTLDQSSILIGLVKEKKGTLLSVPSDFCENEEMKEKKRREDITEHFSCEL